MKRKNERKKKGFYSPLIHYTIHKVYLSENNCLVQHEINKLGYVGWPF